MKPRRLHKLTIFSMRCESEGVLIIFATDEHRLTQIQTTDLEGCAPSRPCSRNQDDTVVAPSVFIRGNLWLAPCLVFDLILDRVGDEALLMGSMIHFLDPLFRRMVIAGEVEAL